MPSQTKIAAIVAVSIGLLQRTHADYQNINGPSSSAAQPAWLANLTAWRTSTLKALNYSGSLYDTPQLQWTWSAFVAPQAHLWDAYLFDADANLWTVDRFLDDLTNRYGGIDAVLLWASCT